MHFGEKNLLSDMCFANISSHTVQLSLYCPKSIFFFEEQSFHFNDVLSMFPFWGHAFGVTSKKLLPNPMSHIFPPLFSSICFIFLGFAFMSTIFFEGVCLSVWCVI